MSYLPTVPDFIPLSLIPHYRVNVPHFLSMKKMTPDLDLTAGFSGFIVTLDFDSGGTGRYSGGLAAWHIL